jgi:hypothetical protein
MEIPVKMDLEPNRGPNRKDLKCVISHIRPKRGPDRKEGMHVFKRRDSEEKGEDRLRREENLMKGASRSSGMS